MDSYITPEEWVTLALQETGQHEMGYTNVSRTQLSIAMHYGGATVNGAHYTYMPDTDELIREDILTAVDKMRKQRAAEDRQAAKQLALGL
jgi:hypothetical protein